MFLFEFSSHSNDIILIFLLKKIVLTQVDFLGLWFEPYLDLTHESGFYNYNGSYDWNAKKDEIDGFF